METTVEKPPERELDEDGEPLYDDNPEDDVEPIDERYLALYRYLVAAYEKLRLSKKDAQDAWITIRDACHLDDDPVDDQLLMKTARVIEAHIHQKMEEQKPE